MILSMQRLDTITQVAQELLTTSRALGVTVPQSHYLSTSTCLFNLFHAKIKLDVKKKILTANLSYFTRAKNCCGLKTLIVRQQMKDLSLSLSQTCTYTHTPTQLFVRTFLGITLIILTTPPNPNLH